MAHDSHVSAVAHTREPIFAARHVTKRSRELLERVRADKAARDAQRGRRTELDYALGSGVGSGSTPMARSESGDQPASSP
jgi:hypothetical protein